MRKQELIHLHALCLLLRERLEDRAAIPPETVASYDDSHLGPTAVHRRKAEHKDAVLALLDGLATAVSETDRTPDEERGDHPRRADAGGND
jgi:hypothetical protein